MSVNTIPASSSPWDSGAGNSAQLVHYAGVETNGAYYAWCVATAGSCNSATTDGAIAGSSICPRGWKLPTIDEYNTMKSKDGGWDSSKIGRILSGGFFPAAGLVKDGSLSNVSIGGYYWSSTTHDTTYAYDMDFGSGGVSTPATTVTTGFLSAVSLPNSHSLTLPLR